MRPMMAGHMIHARDRTEMRHAVVLCNRNII